MSLRGLNLRFKSRPSSGLLSFCFFGTKVQLLLKKMKSSPDISWNEKEELKYKGETVQGSNVVDLVVDVLSKRKYYRSIPCLQLPLRGLNLRFKSRPSSGLLSFCFLVFLGSTV
jgi:hypothetical protein